MTKLTLEFEVASTFEAQELKARLDKHIEREFVSYFINGIKLTRATVDDRVELVYLDKSQDPPDFEDSSRS